MIPFTDQHFLQYVQNLGPILAGHVKEATPKLRQARQVKELASVERKFRRALVRHPRGIGTYQAFIDQCSNILTARPFFRERDDVFKAFISTALKAKDPVALTRFAFNWNFIQFVIRQGGWEKDRQGKRLILLSKQVADMRQELVECNLPLAISEARNFYRKNPQSHLAYMDFNQISALGLIEAVDKFCTGLKSGAFPHVAIGRMKGNLIDENSQTFIHFYPTERKTLYRLRKLIRTMPSGGDLDYVRLHVLLNEKETESEDKLTTFSDMLNVLSASHVVSGSSHNTRGADEDQFGHDIERFADTAGSRPDNQVEEADGRRAVSGALSRLPMIDQKLMRMRGIEL